jgi:cytochrome c oxidase subunit 2
MLEYSLEVGSTFAGDIDWLVWLVLIIVTPWFIAAEGVFLWFIVRFRARDGVPAMYIEGTEKKYKRWINIPHMLVIFFDIFIIIGAVQVWYNVKQRLPPADQTIRIVGQQWGWSFVHPGADGILDTDDDIRTVEHLHVQVDTLYHFELTSNDVLHSFSVPVFRLKQDAVPGRIITGWFEPTITGSYDLQCAEMCGIGHGIMAARIHIDSPADHAAWIAEASEK